MFEITDYRIQRVNYLHQVSGLDIRMWNDPKHQANVYVFFDEGREIIRMLGYPKAKVFAKGVEYGRQNSQSTEENLRDEFKPSLPELGLGDPFRPRDMLFAQIGREARESIL